MILMYDLKNQSIRLFDKKDGISLLKYDKVLSGLVGLEAVLSVLSIFIGKELSPIEPDEHTSGQYLIWNLGDIKCT